MKRNHLIIVTALALAASLSVVVAADVERCRSIRSDIVAAARAGNVGVITLRARQDLKCWRSSEAVARALALAARADDAQDLRAILMLLACCRGGVSWRVEFIKWGLQEVWDMECENFSHFVECVESLHESLDDESVRLIWTRVARAASEQVEDQRYHSIERLLTSLMNLGLTDASIGSSIDVMSSEDLLWVVPIARRIRWQTLIDEIQRKQHK